MTYNHQRLLNYALAVADVIYVVVDKGSKVDHKHHSDNYFMYSCEQRLEAVRRYLSEKAYCGEYPTKTIIVKPRDNKLVLIATQVASKLKYLGCNYLINIGGSDQSLYMSNILPSTYRIISLESFNLDKLSYENYTQTRSWNALDIGYGINYQLPLECI